MALITSACAVKPRRAINSGKYRFRQSHRMVPPEIEPLLLKMKLRVGDFQVALHTAAAHPCGEPLLQL